MHRAFLPLSLLVFGFVLVPPSARADAVIKTGGNFEVQTIKDIAYNDAKDADPEKHKLDLYLPKGQKDFPVLFFVHGGTWRSGDRSQYGKLGEVFARNGIGTVIISYRLSPKVLHPAHVQDVAKAFAWVHKNIGKHGGKADQIICCGHSAGGHLVALLATDESYLKAEKLELKNIKAVVPISGVYTISSLILAQAFGRDEEVCKKASPLNNVTANHPPFLIIYAAKDFLTLDTMGEQLCKKLKDCKCEASTLKIDGRDHITIIKEAVNADDPTTQAILEFVAKHSDLKLTPKEKK